MTLGSRLRTTLNEYASEYYCEHGDPEETTRIIKEIGLDHMGGDALGLGAGRSVFDMHVLGHPDLALKLAIPHSKWDGVQQNKREATLWQSLSPKKKQYLAPVVDHGPQYYWLVMPKGSSPSELDYNWKHDAEYALDDVVWSEDINEENIVQVNGVPKLCDYGTPPK